MRVRADPGSLLELLLRRNTALRLGLHTPTEEEQPLVVIDGIRLRGISRLHDIPAFHARSVRVLRPTEAVPVYGPQAGHGAIVVITRGNRS